MGAFSAWAFLSSTFWSTGPLRPASPASQVSVYESQRRRNQASLSVRAQRKPLSSMALWGMDLNFGRQRDTAATPGMLCCVEPGEHLTGQTAMPTT